MPTLINPNSLIYQADNTTLDEFKLKTLVPRLGKYCNSNQMIFDIRLLEPGKYSFPYHFHRNAEELIMIISGSLTMRTEDGLKIIKSGELVFFEIGPSGAHQFYNHEQTSCIYLDIKTTQGIDVVEYPDSGKVNITPLNMIYEIGSQVNYNQGESNISSIWENLKKEHS
ncbi:MAG: cupin domain-containing protein [Candidatus Kapaibacterium sp.]